MTIAALFNFEINLENLLIFVLIYLSFIDYQIKTMFNCNVISVISTDMITTERLKKDDEESVTSEVNVEDEEHM